MNIILAKIEDLPRYDGEDLDVSPAMRHAKAGGTPHEKHNFAEAADGWIYGYLPRDGGRNPDRYDLEAVEGKIVDVTVLFTKGRTLIGLYLHATIFLDLVEHPNGHRIDGEPLRAICRTKPKYAFLYPRGKRPMIFAKIPKSNFPVVYGDRDPKWVNEFKSFQRSETYRDLDFSELKRKVTRQYFERGSKARKLALEYYGEVCEACGVEKQDDPILDAVFEVHHKLPYSDDFKRRKIKVADLAVLCANCHRQIHKMPDIADIPALALHQKKFKHPTPQQT